MGEDKKKKQSDIWDSLRVPDVVKQRIDVVKKQSKFWIKLRIRIKKLIPVIIIAGVAIFLWNNSIALQLFVGLLQFVGQLLFAVFFMIVQFGSLFWFMSRSKIERIRPEDPKTITFDDYWGQPRHNRLVRQWLGLLTDRKKFVSMGGKYINGLLMYGPPGTGKTMLAKAMAGEAGVAFISIEGSGFRAMFMGVDVMKMIWFVSKARKLARRYGAAIAFIDEIDAIGESRGGVMGGNSGGGFMGMGGGTAALTRLLYEMDGVESKTLGEKIKGRIYKLMGKKPPERDWHVLFMGSTNRPDVLDPALKRPGRFDQLIQIDKPDKAGRREVVDGYLKKIAHDDSVDVESIVINNKNATPAQIMSAITKDAVRIALFDHRDAVSQDDIDSAFLQQYMGIENPVEEMDEDQRWTIAVHEAGHAVATHFLMPDRRIAHVSIVRRGGAMGFVLGMEEVEIYGEPLSRIVRRIMVSMAGQAAVRVVHGESWTGAGGGAGSDYESVRMMLHHLYHEGFFGPPTKREIPSTTSKGRKSEDEVWQELHDQTEDVLRKHKKHLIEIAQNLMDHNSLSSKEVLRILNSDLDSK